jgi:hypothetical protein
MAPQYLVSISWSLLVRWEAQVGWALGQRPPSLVEVVSDVSHDVGALATEALGGGR